MTELSYSFRPHPFSSEQVYLLRPDRLEWKNDHHEGRIAYGDIDRICFRQVHVLGSSKRFWCWVFFLRSGGKIRLGEAHHVRFRVIENRAATCVPFVKELQKRVAAANPNVVVVTGRHWLDPIEGVAGWIVVLLMRAIRRADLDRSAMVAGWLLRRIGPRLRGHRVARDQFAIAFPEKSAAECERILAGMWDNLGRVLVEYAHLDRLWDYDPANPNSGRIMMDQTCAERLVRLGEDHRPALMFSAHIGNWEVPALAAPRDIVLVYRAPRIGPVADELARIRASCVAGVISASPDAPLRIREELKRGAMVGMLVDQHYTHGVDVMFFGRRCKVNPLLARFARLFECPIYGSRVVRLPDGRFRFEMTDPLEVPRDAQGKIDVARTMQLVTSIIEGWIREYPEQWMWLHRRWR